MQMARVILQNHDPVRRSTVLGLQPTRHLHYTVDNALDPALTEDAKWLRQPRDLAPYDLTNLNRRPLPHQKLNPFVCPIYATRKAVRGARLIGQGQVLEGDGQGRRLEPVQRRQATAVQGATPLARRRRPRVRRPAAHPMASAATATIPRTSAPP